MLVALGASTALAAGISTPDKKEDAAPAEIVSAPADTIPSDVENAVVKVFSTIRYPDPSRPWTKQAPTEVTASGVVIEGKRILTNAHAVLYASQVQVQANRAGDKISATVVAVGPGINLAVLKLDDESLFNTHAPIARAQALPQIKDAVLAYGFPTGGTSLSLTKGIVSRIEFVPYNYPWRVCAFRSTPQLIQGTAVGPRSRTTR